MNKQSAFTLLELIIALSVITILTGIAIPTLFDLLNSKHSITTRDMLLNAINFTRIEAISHTTTVTLCPQENENSCGKDWSDGIVIFKDVNEDGKIDQEEEILHELPPMREGDSLRWLSFGSNNYLRYNQLGYTLNQNGSFIYCPKDKDSNHAQVIIINRSGRARVAVDRNNNGIVEQANGRDVTCS